jgi:hypothetical protein
MMMRRTRVAMVMLVMPKHIAIAICQPLPGTGPQGSIYLEHLSRPLLEGVEADAGTAEGEEGLTNLGAPFVTDGQPTIPMRPSGRPPSRLAHHRAPFAGSGSGDADGVACSHAAFFNKVIPYRPLQCQPSPMFLIRIVQRGYGRQGCRRGCGATCLPQGRWCLGGQRG